MRRLPSSRSRKSRVGSVIRMPRWPVNEKGAAQVFPEQLRAGGAA